ncbi:MAG: ComF family protein [Gammaproteobacteria bacterium]|nr:ComF family protein [Gammaproteobacteria bacterium]MBT5223515.1 ComF family protein [Gammaproteobacteria bacterium]MBT5826623.1 ComF family protein [Gammaproteobacteria bacterium]MBT5965929.1 ComF family protein [Gammaproteobacteria bacterium]MBT6419804.1 ComF family protein [Gammaproteobacteria bacterium]
MKMVNNWCNIIQYSLLPPSCILCGNRGMPCMDLCQPCYDGLLTVGNHCYCCARPFATDSINPHLCGKCQKHPPAFDRTYAPYFHQGAIRYLINHCKFSGAYKYSRLLGLLLADFLANNAELPELIIPVPLHPKRYRQRGFNQTLEIGKIIAQELSIPIDNNCCLHVKNSPHQISLSGKQRHKNIKNAFQLKTIPKAHHIAILDDVLTTGATANELARVIKASGVNRVDVWVCARA